VGDHRVRNIDTKWRNLAEGFLCIKAFEKRFHAEWGPQLEKVRRERNEVECQRLRRRGHATLIAALTLAYLLVAVALILTLLSSSAVTVVLVLAFVAPSILAFHGLWSLLHTPDSVPVPSDLFNRWWSTISGRATLVRRSGPALSARRYGDEGEEAFVTYLAGRLSEEYVAVRGLLVARNLDADVIVVGPTGIWVYEVKHWSGKITCESGKWRRVKVYRERGDRLVQEHETIRPFDKQWVKEADVVKETLRRRLPQHQNLREAVGGGLVFTHERLSFSADGSCKARVYTPKSCMEALRISSEIPGLTMEKRLRIVDTLLEWSDRLYDQQEKAPSATASSVELAEFLHEDAVTRAVSYLSDSGEAPGGATAAVGGSHGGS